MGLLHRASSLLAARVPRCSLHVSSQQRCASGPVYTQGQAPAPKIREYFYYVDHQGMLFLDDSRMKNFTSCLKETKFLQFFFSRMRLNRSDRYPEFPYISLCGREVNYVRCDDLPIVFTHFIESESDSTEMRYNFGSASMTYPFEPSKVVMEPSSGRVYHPTPLSLRRHIGDVALVHTKLALNLAAKFQFSEGEDNPPTHLHWQGEKVELDYELLKALENLKHIRQFSLGLS